MLTMLLRCGADPFVKNKVCLSSLFMRWCMYACATCMLPRLHYRLLALCPAPTDPVGQSWRVDMHACKGLCRNTYTCKYALVYARHACMYARVYKCMQVCACVDINVQTWIEIHVCLPVRVQMQAHV